MEIEKHIKNFDCYRCYALTIVYINFLHRWCSTLL